MSNDIFSACLDHLKKEALELNAAKSLGARLRNVKGLQSVATHLDTHGSKYDLAGLGGMMALEGSHMLHSAKKNPTTGKRDWRGLAESGAETAFLGSLAAPVAAKMLLGKAGH